NNLITPPSSKTNPGNDCRRCSKNSYPKKKSPILVAFYLPPHNHHFGSLLPITRMPEGFTILILQGAVPRTPKPFVKIRMQKPTRTPGLFVEINGTPMLFVEI